MKQNKLKFLLSLIMLLSALSVSAYDFMVDGIAYHITLGEQVNPTGSNSGYGRVRCGGSYYSDDMNCRIKARYYYASSSEYINLGFRIVLDEEAE